MGLSNSRNTRQEDSPSSGDTGKEAPTAEGKVQKFGLLRRLKGKQAVAEESKNGLEAPSGSIGLPALPEQDHAAAEDHVQAYGICQPLGSYFSAHVDSFRIAQQAGRAPEGRTERPVNGHPNSRLGPKLNAKTVSWGQSSAIPKSPFAAEDVEERLENTTKVSDRQNGKEPETSLMDAPLEGEGRKGAVDSSAPTSKLLSAGKTCCTKMTLVSNICLSCSLLKHSMNTAGLGLVHIFHQESKRVFAPL